MKTKRIGKLIAAAAALIMTGFAPGAQACSVCFGRSDSPLAQGMNMGVLTLLVVVSFVLVGIASFGVFLARRSAQVAAKANLRDSQNLS